MRACCALLSLALSGWAGDAVIAGRVIDAGTRRESPATVVIRTSAGSVVTDHPSFRGGIRVNGRFEKTVPPGRTVIAVSRGFDFLPVEQTIELRPDERREIVFELRRRSPLREEGWYAGDNHDHMIHGERDVTVDFAYASLAGQAEGLDYLALAQAWHLPEATPEALDEACTKASTPDFTLTWNLEQPKNYYRGDAGKCLGHGWTAGMRGRTREGLDAVRELNEMNAHDFESDKPPVANFESHALIHVLGGAVSYTHPCRWWRGTWGGKGIYPVEKDKFISNMAVELPFDTVAGPTYDMIDVLMQPQEKAVNACAEQLWFMLLNKGYRIAASGSTDATFDRPGGGVPGRVRVYTRLPGGFSVAAAADAMRAGRSFVTTGPLLTLEVDGHASGEVVRMSAGEAQRKVRIRAWGPSLKKVELIRNGETVRTFDLDPSRTEFETTFETGGRGRTWYVARCIGTDPNHQAITNPVYFEPDGFEPPKPAMAKVSLTVSDGATGRRLDGTWEVVRMIGRRQQVESSGRFTGGTIQLTAPATARIRIAVPGYEPVLKSILLDHRPLLGLTTNLRPENLTDWRTYEEIRRLLGDVRLDVKLAK